MCTQVSQNADEIKKRGVSTHYIYEHMIPVYAIAITERNYFEDDRAFRVIGFCDLETKEEFKVEIKGIKEKRNLMLMAFLELKKYSPDSINQSKKLQWFEFFSNKPFTREPDEIISSADHELDYRTWTEEEKIMYNETIRKNDAYYGSLLYQRKKGIEQGKLETFISLVQEGLLTKEQASEKLGIPVSEFEKYL